MAAPKACVEVERKIQDNFNNWKPPRWIEDNLSKEERTLLKEIKNDENIVYMWEDKGPSFVKMTREQYITAGEKELEKDCYQIVPNDPSEKGKAENDKLVQKMLRGGEISDKVTTFLQNGDKSLSNFYHIVKTHKIPPCIENPVDWIDQQGLPVRGIISAR